MLASGGGQSQKSGSSSSNSSYIFTNNNGSSNAFEIIGDFIEDGSFLVLNKSAGDGDGQRESHVPAALIQEFDYEGPSSSAVVQSAGTETSTTSTQGPQVTRTDMDQEKFKSAQSSLNMILSKISADSGAAPDKNMMIASSTSSTASASSNNLISSADVSLEDVMAQVDRLKSENETLKVSMSEMNVSMKKNLNMFKDWQNTVSSIHEDHQKKYEQSKEIVDSLRQENLMLKSQSSSSLLQNQNQSFVQVESIETQIRNKELEIKRLSEQLDEHVALVEEERLQNHHLKEMIRVQNEERSKCSDEKKKADDEIILEKDNQIKVLHAALDSSKICIDKFREEHAKKVDEIKILQEEKKILQEEIQKSIMEHNTKTSNQQGSNEKAFETQIMINNLKQVIVNLETENTNLKTRNAALSSENEQLEFFRAQLEVYRVDFEAEREGRASMANARDTLQQENIKLKDELEKKTGELEKLHGTHLNLANEHIDRPQIKRVKLGQDQGQGARASANSSTSAVDVISDEIGDVINYIKRDLLGFGNDNNPTPAGSTSTNQTRTSSEERSSARAISPCPLCQRKFASLVSLADHASECGLEGPSSPFVFP